MRVSKVTGLPTWIYVTCGLQKTQSVQNGPGSTVVVLLLTSHEVWTRGCSHFTTVFGHVVRCFCWHPPNLPVSPLCMNTILFAKISSTVVAARFRAFEFLLTHSWPPHSNRATPAGPNGSAAPTETTPWSNGELFSWRDAPVTVCVESSFPGGAWSSSRATVWCFPEPVRLPGPGGMAAGRHSASFCRLS